MFLRDRRGGREQATRGQQADSLRLHKTPWMMVIVRPAGSAGVVVILLLFYQAMP
jgi:hypothetical protein